MMNHSILLVEDDANDEALTKRALARSPFKLDLHVERDGAGALDYLFGPQASGRALPNFVLLDLKLPKVDGFEVLRRIRADERTRLLPVIILTSSREEIDLIEGYEEGANSYIVKPVESESFSKCIESMGRYWLALNEHAPQGAR